MADVTFAEIADLFLERVNQLVWCSAATVDRQDRPRSRVLHPIWEVINGRPVGWVATTRNSLKSKHLARRPALSLAYIAEPLTPIYVDCAAGWADDAATKQRIWNWFKSTPPPMGYDPAQFFGNVDNPEYGVLRLDPWRLEMGNLLGESKIWYG